MSFPRYPKYKDSGVEWLGAVPEHWDVSRLGFESWVRARLGWKGLKAEEYVDDGFAFLSTPNIKGLGIDFENVNFITQERFDESPEIKVREGDVLLAKDGSTLGTVNVVRHLPRPTTVNSSIAVITPNTSLSGVFLYYVFASSYMEQTIERTKGGMGVPHLFQADLNKFYLPLPTPPEQTAIAAFLDRETAKIDGLVAEQQRLIELLKEKRQAVISHAVTKGLNPHAPMKPSGVEWLGEVPQAWTVTKLGRAVFMQEGPGPRHWQFTYEGTRVICVTNITEAGIDFTRLEKFISTEEYHSSYRHFTVRRGDVLLSSSGNSWGKVAIYEAEEEVILNTSTIRLSESEGAPLNCDYIAMLLQSDTVREQLGLAMTGSCQPNFGPSHLNSVMVAIPSRAEQSAIVKHLDAEVAKIDTLTAEAQRAIDLLQERRTALISAAVTGQIDVRTQTANHE
jgi:type I restriction enzyme S subunit